MTRQTTRRQAARQQDIKKATRHQEGNKTSRRQQDIKKATGRQQGKEGTRRPRFQARRSPFPAAWRYWIVQIDGARIRK